MNNLNVSKNFKLYEFECPDGSHLVKVHSKLVLLLQMLRDAIGKPINVISGYRSYPYNKVIGGAPKSQHLDGKAADISVVGMDAKTLAILAENMGFTGIGIYTHNGNNFVHCDIRQTKTVWKDSKDGKLIVIKSAKEA